MKRNIGFESLRCLTAVGMLTGAISLQAAPAKKLTIGISVPSATHGWTGGVVWSANRAKKELERENPDLSVIVTTGATAAEVNIGRALIRDNKLYSLLFP